MSSATFTVDGVTAWLVEQGVGRARAEAAAVKIVEYYEDGTASSRRCTTS